MGDKILNDFYDIVDDKLKNSEGKFECLIPDSISNDEKDDFLLNLKVFFIKFVFIKNSTGIVISGFEKDSLSPSYTQFSLSYLYDNEFHIFNKEEDHIGDETASIVKPLAQVDVITTFLNSIDLDTELNIKGYFNEMQDKYYENIISAIKNNKKIKGKNEQYILNEINKLSSTNEGLKVSVEDFINKLKVEHSAPILNSIASLPYEELSNLAESLIKITSLKVKVQSDLETVGGDVDVAIITKGDGFIWTKRKHYFEADLNPQFFNR